MQPRKRARLERTVDPETSGAIRLGGGHREKRRTIEAYRAGLHVDVEVRSAEGKSFHAHGLVLMAGSDYFAAAFSGGWAAVSGHHALGAVPADALEACLEWMYTGECVAADDGALRALFDAAHYLQINSLLKATVRNVFIVVCLTQGSPNFRKVLSRLYRSRRVGME